MQKKRYHILVDVSGVSPEVVNDREGLISFLNHFPSLIGMHILAGPLIHEGVPENPGLSGVIIIDYSHISVHTFTETNEALVDIFSCKPYDQQEAQKNVLEYFKTDPANAQIQVVSWG